MLLCDCCSCWVCENKWKVCVYFCVCTCDSRWRMGRQDGAGDDEWGDRQRRIALYPSVTIPLSLSLSSLSLPVGMMQCLLFCGSEEENDGGKMGRRWKEKNCIHPQSMFTSAPFPPPPLLPSFPTFAATLPPFPSPLFLPLLHPRPASTPLCWSESVVSIVPFGVIQLPPLLFFAAVSHCFFSTILIISKEFLPPRYAFSYLISVCTHLPERIFFVAARAAFFQVNFSSSRVNRSAFICTRIWCFFKCVCVCVICWWIVDKSRWRGVFVLRSGPGVLKGSGVLGQGRDMGSPRTHTNLEKKNPQCAESHESMKIKLYRIPFLWITYTLLYYEINILLHFLSLSSYLAYLWVVYIKLIIHFSPNIRKQLKQSELSTILE